MPETARERVRRLARPFGRALAPHFFCSFLLALHGCTVKRPQVPIIDLTVSISVADDTTTIRDVAKRTEFLRIDPDDRLALDFVSEFEAGVEIGDSLRMNLEQGTFGTRLGADPDSRPGTSRYRDLPGQPAGYGDPGNGLGCSACGSRFRDRGRVSHSKTRLRLQSRREASTCS